VKKPVDAHGVRQPLAVGDLQGLVGAVAEPADLGALLGGEDGGAQRAEDVVERGGAFAVAGVGTEAQEHAGLGELAQAVLGAVLRVEPDLGELGCGEDAVLVDEVEDGAVAVGQAAGEGGELLGDAPPPGGATPTGSRARTWAGTLARGGDVVVHAGGLRQESAALNELVTVAVTCGLVGGGGAGSEVGGRLGARPAAGPADRPASACIGGCRRGWALTRETRVWRPAGLRQTLRSKRPVGARAPRPMPRRARAAGQP
jgi:hypothetical protein